jgi:DNA-binding beta-propeller fold protein YncE
MTLQLAGFIDLPPHAKPGVFFDHAAVHAPTGRVFVAHMANDAVDVIDAEADRFLFSVPGLAGVAGVLVSEERDLVFTSNRGENTVGWFRPDRPRDVRKVGVGLRPNGLAFDPSRGLLLAANVGDPGVPGSFTVSFVDVDAGTLVASVPAPGRTKWALFEPSSGKFLVNISDPAQIAVYDAKAPGPPASFPVPCPGPHGLDLDAARGRLYCACDGGRLVTLDAATGRVLHQAPISGAPDVIFHHPGIGRLYVAIGNPGVVDVFDTSSLRRIQVLETEKGAKTTA